MIASSKSKLCFVHALRSIKLSRFVIAFGRHLWSGNTTYADLHLVEWRGKGEDARRVAGCSRRGRSVTGAVMPRLGSLPELLDAEEEEGRGENEEEQIHNLRAT